MDHHLRALILHSFIQKSTVLSSSSIQTVLSAPESHRIMPLGSRALPPVGNLTLPWRYLFVYFNTLSVICKSEFLFYLVYWFGNESSRMSNFHIISQFQCQRQPLSVYHCEKKILKRHFSDSGKMIFIT